MKVNAGRKVGTVAVVVLVGALTTAQAGGAKDFGQRVVKSDTVAQPCGCAKDFGQ